MGRRQKSNTAILITTNESPRDLRIRERTYLLAAALGLSVSEIGRAALEAATANPHSIKPYLQARRRGSSSGLAN